jgi:SlyX protein
MDDKTEARLNELESKLAFAEDLIETLNETIIRQQGQIDLMQHQLRLLNEQLQSPSTNEPRNLRDEIPPHY